MRLMLVLVLIACSASVSASDSTTISALTPHARLLARALYPNVLINDREGTGWRIEVRSDASVRTPADAEYVFLTWNEINHPGVSTNYEYDNYGGMGVFLDGELLDSVLSDNLTIADLVQTPNGIYALTETVSAYHGESEENLVIYRLSERKLEPVFRMQTGKDTTAMGGTTFMQADIERKDLNGDGIADLVARAKSYKVVDLEPIMDDFTVLEETTFIFE